MKLWQGRFEEESDPVFEKMNRSLGIDAVLLDVDIRASRAHARSLMGCGVLTQEEWKAIDQGLEQILSEYTPEQVKATPYEDIHTFVEATLLKKVETLSEASKVMLMPTHRRDRDKWMKDAQLMVDASAAAVEAAKKKDLDGLANLNDALYASCVTCHKDYRPGYGR